VGESTKAGDHITVALALGEAEQGEAGQGGTLHSLKRSDSAKPVALMWHKALRLCCMQVRH